MHHSEVQAGAAEASSDPAPASDDNAGEPRFVVRHCRGEKYFSSFDEARQACEGKPGARLFVVKGKPAR